MKIIDGKTLAASIRTEVKEKISKLGFPPSLAAILVGDDPASRTYLKLKESACADAGIHFEKFEFPEGAPQEKIISKIMALNERRDIHAILVQLPLPAGFDTDEVIASVDPKKDVDGFHPENLKLLKVGKPRIIPPTPAGILKLIESTNVNLQNKNAVLLVNSETFALPINYLLEQKGIEVDIKLNSKPSTLNPYDIIVIALGRPNFLKANAVKDGTIIVDVGTTQVSGKTVGDADFESFRDRDVWITPVPGGVGPMTVAKLISNVYELAVRKNLK